MWVSLIWLFGLFAGGVLFRNINRILNNNHEHQKRLKLAHSIAGLADWEYHPEAGKLYCSDNFFDMFDLNRDDFNDDFDTLLTLLSESERKDALNSLKESVEHRLPIYSVREFKLKDGRRIHLQIQGDVKPGEGGPLIFVGTVLDVSRYREMQQKLIEAHKMDSIGNLAGGIAHDFNNMLTPVLGLVEVFGESEKDEQRKAQLELVRKTCQRMKEMTGKLLGFGRRGKDMSAPVGLNQVCSDVMTLLQHSRRKEVQIEFSPEEPLYTMKGDPSQMHQLIMNLCVNAIDSISGEGKVSIRTFNISREQALSLKLGEGVWISLEVEDTGSGIPEEFKDRIFEPFFSTKYSGSSGTGLGLSMVYGMLQNHGGSIDFDTSAQGTVFKVYLPALEQYFVANHLAPEDELSFVGSENKAKILIAEDEEPVRKSLEILLQKMGYDVTSAGDGQEAVTRYQETQGDFQLVILDVQMPNLDGEGAFLEMKKYDPDVKVLLMSGYAVDGKVQSLVDLGAKGFIKKPFGLEELRNALRASGL
jgi:signal transduction histidine kinase